METEDLQKSTQDYERRKADQVENYAMQIGQLGKIFMSGFNKKKSLNIFLA